ncbi:hypothetical protein KR084_003035 [Drosophila pseudotakahashii]|nr:hypothetical protein KR084_003035 [Drosophila pseudotakahashii]
MSHALVNEEKLEALVYERSKAWSSIVKVSPLEFQMASLSDGRVFLQDFSTGDDGMEMDVSEFDNLFHDDDENSDLQYEEEEAKEDNGTDAKLELGHINATSVAELTMMLCAGEDNEGKVEIEEILNQTVPVVEEHKRKWREAGLDRILETFDEKQIEHHVGHWMRRHNSVYLNAPPTKYLHTAHGNSISDQSDESLHSIDTARYIQQSRRRNAHMTNKNPNLTTIKMYRKHSHKRDELRAKYAYDDEQEHRHHMQALLHRRREKERKLAYLASTPMHCTYSSGHHVRRKHLRKRRNNSWIFESSSSSEDDPSFSGCDCHSCRRHQALSRSAYQYCAYGRDQHEYLHRQAASRTMHTTHRHHTFDVEMDLRPRLPENECSCCNSDRLCSNFVHIANSSTEEWVVENRSSPLRVGKQDRTRKHKQMVAVRKTSPQSVRSKCHEQRLLKTKAASASKLVKSKANYTEMFDSDTSGEDNVLPRKELFCYSERRKGNLVPITKAMSKTTTNSASTAKKAVKKAINPKSLPQIKEEEPTRTPDVLNMLPTGRSKKLAIPKSESSDLSEGETRRPKRLVMESGSNKNTKKDITASLIKEKDISVGEKDKAFRQKANKCIESESSDSSNDEVMERESIVSLSATNKKSKCPAAKKITKRKTFSTSEEMAEIPEVIAINSSLSSCNSEKKRPVAPKGKAKKTSEKVNTMDKLAAKTSTAGVKKTVGNSAKKKNTSSATTKMPQIGEETQNLVPDSQKTPNPKGPNSNVKKVGESSTEDIPKDKFDSEEELQRALALSKTSYKEEQQKRRKTKKQASKEQPQSSAEQSLAVFNNQSVACNSTALANDTACKRVLTKRRAVKRVAAVSTTEEQSSTNSSSSPPGSSVDVVSATGGDPDCTVVTSTTCCEPPAPSDPIPPPCKLTKRGILLHSSSTPGEANFTLTEQGLGKFIGDRWARKYLKYHIGSRSFDSRHSVYYQPTPQLAAALTAPQNAQSLANLSSSSASDDDIFEQMNRYGTVYSVLEKKSGA